MTLILELENLEHWIIRDSQTFATANAPLTEYLSVVTFSSNIIGIVVTVDNAPETWDFAGWLSQIINLPFGSNFTGSGVNDRRLWLRRKQLLIFPQLASTYKIAIQFPKWFTQASITIWEYLGPQIDTVEQKLDTLLQQHPP